MKILLCAATALEIGPTIARLAANENSNVAVAVTGVGLLASTYAIAKAVAARRPGLLIQAGIAGTFDEGQPLGKVVAVRSETVADAGVEEGGAFRSLFDLNLLDAGAHPWKDRKLTNTNNLLFACGLPLADGITVNEISTDKSRMAHYHKTYNAPVESMEGAASHYVGLMEAVPFLQIRSLSNFTGERDKTKWRMQEAVLNLNNELQRILKNLTA